MKSGIRVINHFHDYIYFRIIQQFITLRGKQAGGSIPFLVNVLNADFLNAGFK